MPGPHDSESKRSVIPAHLIREVVMPYEYQKPQDWFVSKGAEQNTAEREIPEDLPNQATAEALEELDAGKGHRFENSEAILADLNI